MQTITAPELAAWLANPERPDPMLLDVREAAEFAICQIPGARLIPMNTVTAHLSELNEETEIVCICHHGGRSMQVASFLERQGFSKVINLTGGVHAWALQVDSSMPTY